MTTTGKKRLTIEYDENNKQNIRDFKSKCYRIGKSIQQVILELIDKYLHNGK